MNVKPHVLKLIDAYRPRVRVYIAGPISKGDQHVNVRNACLAWHDLINHGYAPICPHWSAVQQMITPKPSDVWYDFDYNLLEVCQAVLRIPGESDGADGECELVVRLGIPVYRSVYDLVRGTPPTRTPPMPAEPPGMSAPWE